VTPASNDRSAAGAAGERRHGLRRYAPLAVTVVLVALAYGFGLHRGLSFETLVGQRIAIDQFIASHAGLAMAVYISLYVLVVALSLPVGAILTVIGGFLFGAVLGTIAAYLGALGGATAIFLIARSAIGEFLTKRAGPFAAKLAEGFQADAFNYLLFLRLVPFPFWLVNLAPAMFDIPLKTFVAASAIGIIPATAAIATLGAGLGSVITAQEPQYNACLAAGRSDCAIDFDPSLVLTPTLLAALVALGVLALLPVVARRMWRRRIGTGIPSKH
jgi:uncharacterized membrane protein YdjX (TVP38/TMEM64 family)